MIAKTIHGKSSEDIQSSFQRAMSADSFKPTVAIIFISIKQDRDSLCDMLDAHDIDVIGATSSGEFIDGHQSEGEISIMLMDINKAHYAVLFEDIGQRSLEDAAMHFARNAMQKFEKPGIVLCSSSINRSGEMLDGEILIRSIEKEVGPNVSMFGGMAGDDITFSGTYVFTHGKESDYGIVALILDENKISMNGLALSGWQPMGISRTITKSKGNLVYTIDDRPALEMYLKYLGSEKTSAEDQLQFFNSLGNMYPIQIERKDRAAKICNPIGYNQDENALEFESEVPQGSTFRFSMPPEFDIVDTVLEHAQSINKASDRGADALLIFSCAGRLAALGPMAQEENEGLHEVWNAPMAGFYTYGEFGKGVDGKHDFHSTTNSWVVLKEK